MTSNFLENVKMFLFSQAMLLHEILRENYILKKSDIKNLILLFLFHGLSFDILEKKIKIGGHQTNYLSIKYHT